MNMREGRLIEADLDDNVADRFRLADGMDHVPDHDTSWLAWFFDLHFVNQLVLIAAPCAAVYFCVEAWL